MTLQIPWSIIAAQYYTVWSIQVAYFILTDRDCQDICVIGACSFSCSTTEPCPFDYSCLASRCYARCPRTPDCCGFDKPHYYCRVGIAYPVKATGLCLYSSQRTENPGLPVVSQICSKHKKNINEHLVVSALISTLKQCIIVTKF